MYEEKTQVFKLTSERIWRTYLGGKLLDSLHGKSGGEDGHFPEDMDYVPGVRAQCRTGRQDRRFKPVSG
jgi:mannose-6-phosphate isomerase